MEIPVTAGPWLVLGLVLGTLLTALGAVAVPALRRPRRPGGPPAAGAPLADPVVDDLPGFLQSPPGSAPAAAVPDAAWPPLSAPLPPPPAGPAPRGSPGSTGVLVAMGVTTLLLIGLAAAVAVARTPESAGDLDARREPTPVVATRTPVPVSAELAFDSVVLERHAVGVTVARPRLRVATVDGRITAEIELATFNCLRDRAPRDPEAAGCSRSVPEYAQLSEPELRVRTTDDILRLSGAFPTWRRPNGSPPVRTGRVYEIQVTVEPRDGRADEAGEAAGGRLELGGERVALREDEPGAISYGG